MLPESVFRQRAIRVQCGAVVEHINAIFAIAIYAYADLIHEIGVSQCCCQTGELLCHKVQGAFDSLRRIWKLDREHRME